VAGRDLPRADATVAAVTPRGFFGLAIDDIGKKLVMGGCFIDVKAIFPQVALAGAGFRVWRL
jgi:UDP-N-acetyl-D-galactosamine dehydrogenase